MPPSGKLQAWLLYLRSSCASESSQVAELERMYELEMDPPVAWVEETAEFSREMWDKLAKSPFPGHGTARL